jgi:hypothetical protein
VEGWGLRRRTEGLWDPIVFEKKAGGLSGTDYSYNRLMLRVFQLISLLS